MRLARENTSWGYVRIVGELRKLGINVSATLVRSVLAEAGIPPAPQRDRTSWRTFLRQHGDSMLACDFLTVDTVWLRRLHVLVFLTIGSRRVEYVACTSNPDTAWMLQQARNLLVDLDDRDRPVRSLIHDRDSKFSAAFDAVFSGEGVRIVRTPVRAPNANAHVERWVGSVRRECLDRLLILGRRQLEYVLRIYVQHYNGRRPHRALGLEPPDPTPAVLAARGDPPAPLTTLRRRDLLGGPIHEYQLAARPSFHTPRPFVGSRATSLQERDTQRKLEVVVRLRVLWIGAYRSRHRNRDQGRHLLLRLPRAQQERTRSRLRHEPEPALRRLHTRDPPMGSLHLPMSASS